MPLNTMWLTLKRSSASCVFIVALVMLMPERNSTTGLPARVPVVNSLPLTLYLRASCSFDESSTISGWKAEITAMRGVSSSRTVLPGAGRPAHPARPAASAKAARMERQRLISRSTSVGCRQP